MYRPSDSYTRPLMTVAWRNISTTVMVAASEVPFIIDISELDSAGKAVRKAWGSTM